MWIMVAFVLGEVAAYQIGMSVFILLGAVLTALASIKVAKKRIKSDLQKDDVNVIFWKDPMLYRAFLLLFFFLLGWGRMRTEMRPDALEEYIQENDGTAYVKLVGTIESFSEKNGLYTAFLKDISIDSDIENVPDGLENQVKDEHKIKKIVATFQSDLVNENEIHSGSRVFLSGMAEFPKKATNPGQFSYWMYYRGLGVKSKINAYEISVFEGKTSPLRRQTERFRKYAKTAFQEICQKQDAGVFQAVLLGDKSELSDELKERFQDNGIAHILAVSGLHVSLIGMSLYGILRYLGASYAMAGIVASVLLTFYGFVTGFGASVFRAVFMVEISCLAAHLGRSYDLLSALSLSLLLQVWQSPYLIFSAGLQLSYGAVAAIGIETELMRERKRRMKEDEESSGRLNSVHETVKISMAIQLYTMPIQLYHYFSFPLFGILLNFVVIPLLAYAAGSGILALGIYSIACMVKYFSYSRYLSKLIKMTAGACTGPGHYIFMLYEWLCIQAEKMPLHSINPGRPSGIKIALFYLVLAIRYLYVMEKLGERLNKKVADITLVGVVSLFLMINPVHGFQVWFLDVGQGDGVLMRTKHATILSDCGSSQDKKIGKNVLIPFLESQGIRKLDWVLVSHADADHINGIEWLLKEEYGIRINNLALPAAGKGQEAYEKLEKLAKDRGADVYYLHRGEQIQAKALTLDCIYPEADEKSEEDRNSHSLVFDVTYGDFDMLLTGDIGAADEAKILTMEENEKADNKMTEIEKSEVQTDKVTILKAAHHGSAGSSSEEFLEHFSPAYTILSYGKGNTYGHPAPEAVERLELVGTKILRTAESGAVNVWTDGKKMRIKGYKQQK